MKKYLIKKFCTLTLLSFTTTSLFADNVRITSNHKNERLEQTASILSSLFLAQKISAKRLYEAISKLGLSQDEKNAVFVNLVQVEKVPLVNTRGDDLLISLNSKTIKVSYKDADKNIIVVDGKSFKYDAQKGFDRNVRALFKQVTNSGNKVAFESLSFLLPQAHAMGGDSGEMSKMLPILLLIGVAVGGFLIFNKASKAQSTADQAAQDVTALKASFANDHRVLGELNK